MKYNKTLNKVYKCIDGENQNHVLAVNTLNAYLLSFVKDIKLQEQIFPSIIEHSEDYKERLNEARKLIEKAGIAQAKKKLDEAQKEADKIVDICEQLIKFLKKEEKLVQ